MKILAFCFFPAFVPPSNGGQSRLFNFYRALSQWHEIVLLTSTHIGVEEEIINHGNGFIERRIPKDDYFVQQYIELEKYSSGGDLSGPAIAASGGFPTRLHTAYLEEYEKTDIIIHDCPFNSAYDLFAGTDGKPRIYNAYNCEAQLYRQLHPAETSHPIHEVVQQAELRMLRQADLVLYCNEADLTAFQELLPAARYDKIYAPNGMTPHMLSYQARHSAKSGRSAVFLGSIHPPNAFAAQFIVQTLSQQVPEVTFHLIGSCLPEGNYPANVRRHGMVSDTLKMELLANADLALNPMAEGSGSNVKVLDYFSYGLPVLSTPFGMRGINAEPGKSYLETCLNEFGDAIRNVLTDTERLKSIGAAGKSLALERYTWQAIAEPVSNALEKLANNKKANTARYVLALNDYDSFEATGGGGTRSRGLYANVSRWSPVVFVSFSGEGRLQAKQYAEGITVIIVPKTLEHLAELQRVNSQFHVSVDDIVASRQCLKNPLLSAVYRVLRSSARCIVIEHCYLAPLPYSWGDRFVYSSHNHEAELKKELLEWHPQQEEFVGAVDRVERYAVEGSAAIIAVSQADAENLIRGGRTAGPVIVVRNGATAPVSGMAVKNSKSDLQDQISKRSVVFLGSAHMPNVDAAKYMVEKLAIQCPDVQFHLLGSVCSAMQNVPDNVRLWGVVDEITKSAVMQTCSLAINPMLSGSGSNVKLADYIGNGLFVVTTIFGCRGYPRSAHEHIHVATLKQFPEAIESALRNPECSSEQSKQQRFALFIRELSMESLAERFTNTLKALETPKKRVLYVAYRYCSPAMGGAEVNIEKFVSALGHSGEFDMDVIAPEVSAIHNHWRFSEHYTFDSQCGAPVDIPNVRFARFSVDTPTPKTIDEHLRHAWRVQPAFERAISHQLLKHYSEPGLAWGWGYPEGAGVDAQRWAFTRCGVYLDKPYDIKLIGYAPSSCVITAFHEHQLVGGPWTVEGNFEFNLSVSDGGLTLESSTQVHQNDPRPLGFLLTRMTLANRPLELAKPMLWQQKLSQLPAEKAFAILDNASSETRAKSDLNLTDGRGPWSTKMEQFIIDHVAEYDLVVSHSNVFRPAVVAIQEANKQGIPSILIPHAHLDDDFYHFPDILKSAQDATLVLAVPKVACTFLESKGCNVSYMPAGCDADEEFTPGDIEEFRALYSDETPFILILGRKAGAKGYQHTIDAVEQLVQDGLALRVVLIGPDDDGVAIQSPIATYLGRQPRSVVRGALLSCLALCNMSTSESFGIVVLEAWIAGKPVILNQDCAAFHDIAVHNENALLVSSVELPEAIRLIFSSPDFRVNISMSGKCLVEKFDWMKVSRSFVKICGEVIYRN
jgi:glycosyltransferase involved in cell wall biosynthesis